jgi:hypothetical protein
MDRYATMTNAMNLKQIGYWALYAVMTAIGLFFTAALAYGAIYQLTRLF